MSRPYFTWESRKDSPTQAVKAEAMRVLKLNHPTSIIHPVWQTGLMGAWLVVQPKQRNWQAYAPALMVGGGMVKDKFVANSTPGFVTGINFFPVLEPTPGLNGRGWLGSTDLNLKLLSWLAESEIDPFQFILDACLATLRCSTSMRDLVAGMLAALPGYRSARPKSRLQCWDYLTLLVESTKAWKNLDRTSRLDLLVEAGLILTFQFPHWDSPEGWNNIGEK